MNEDLGLGGIFNKVQAVIAHAQTVGYFFPSVARFFLGYFDLPFPLYGDQLPSRR
jgi:hypothetical protein